MTSPLPAICAAFFSAASRVFRGGFVFRAGFALLPLLLIAAPPPAHAQFLKPTQEKFTGKTASMVFDWSVRANALCLKARNSACDETKPEGERILGGGFLPNVLNWFQTHPSSGFSRPWTTDVTFLYNPAWREENRAHYFVQIRESGGAWNNWNARNFLPAGVALEGNVVPKAAGREVVFLPGATDTWFVRDTSVTFTGLIAGKRYIARVRATNPNSSTVVSAWVPTQPVLADIDLPAQPTGLNALAADGAVVLAWNPPSGGGPIFSYRYRWSTNNDLTTWDNAGGAAGVVFDVPAGENPRFTVEGFTNGDRYALQIAAENPKGTGEWSNTAIGAPRAFSLDVDNSGLPINGNDGILIARYLAGLRGAALGAGLNLSTNGAETAELSLSGDLSQLDVDGNGAVTVHDGVLIARYLLGVRSRTALSLTAGVAGSDAEVVEAIVDNIVNLGAPAPP